MTTQTIKPRSLEDIYAADTPAPALPAADGAAAETTGDKPVTPAAEPATADKAADATADKGAPPAPQKTEKPDGDWVPLKAHRDEVRKRQEMQKEIEELRRAVKPEKSNAGTVPDPIVDPEGYTRHIEEMSFTRLVVASRADMIDEVGEDDFATKEEAFRAAAAADPKLAERLWNSRDPARYAYTQGKKLLEAKATETRGNDPASLREQIKAEIMAELGLAPAADAQPGASSQPSAAARPIAPPAATRPAVPRSLAGARSAPPTKAEAAKPARRPLDALYDA